MILNCNCQHEFQDSKYGKGRRVHNRIKPSSSASDAQYRCTVCKNTRYGSNRAAETKKK